MLQTKRNHYFDFLFACLGLILFVSLIYVAMDTQGNKAQIKNIQKEIQSSYSSIMEQNKTKAILLFELQFNHPSVTALLKKANEAKDDVTLTSAKEALYQALHFKFQNSRQYFPKQQLYLVNGQSLLRLDSPYEPFKKETTYNVGLQKVIADHVSYYGLALQGGRYLYRFFFPIFDEHHALIAVAEVDLPLIDIQSVLFAEHRAASQFLFSKRQLLDIRNKWKFYEEAILSNDYYVLKREHNSKVHNMNLTDQDFLDLKSDLNSDDEMALLKTEAFSLQNKLKGQDGFTNLLPLHSISGDAVGYLLTYTPKMTATIKKNNSTILLLLIISLFLLLSYYLYRQREKTNGELSFYQHVIEALPFPVFCKDDHNNYKCANSAFLKHFNLESDSPFKEAGKAFENEPDALQISASELSDLGSHKLIKESFADEVGTTELETSLFVVKKENKEIEGLLGFIVDKTKMLATEKRLSAALVLQNQLVDSLNIGVRIFDIDKQVILVNSAFEQLSGFQQNKLLGASCESLFTCMQCSPEVCPLKKSKDENITTHIETIKYNEQGAVRTLALDFKPLYDDKGTLNGIIEISTDISETKSLQDKTSELVVSDELTGLLNLRGLMRSGENYFRLAQRTQKPFFALHFDIHGMRKLNYQFGETSGDRLLKDFANILIETFRDTDLIARIGGDEFVVLLNDSDYKMVDSGHFVRLELNIQKYNLQPEHTLKLLVDTGIVQYTEKTHSSLELLLDQCEKLVYEQQRKRNLS